MAEADAEAEAEAVVEAEAAAEAESDAEAEAEAGRLANDGSSGCAGGRSGGGSCSISGGCSCQALAAWNAVTDQRLQVAFKKILIHLRLWERGVGGCSFSFRLVPPRSNSYTTMAADASTLGEKTIQEMNI